MLDYLTLQGSTENPTFVTILFTVLLAFLLSSLIAFTFEKTSRQVITPVAFLQSLILVSIVAATVMQAIGDSLARGLGMLGALAIIRFRTTLRTPRNMVFTFASLAAGIACGVYGFVIGIIGTIAFCITAFILRFSPMRITPKLIGTLKFDLPISSNELQKIEIELVRFCEKFQKTKYQIAKPKNKEDIKKLQEKLVTYEYQLALKKTINVKDLDFALGNIKCIQSLKISFDIVPENV